MESKHPILSWTSLELTVSQYSQVWCSWCAVWSVLWRLSCAPSPSLIYQPDTPHQGLFSRLPGLERRRGQSVLTVGGHHTRPGSLCANWTDREKLSALHDTSHSPARARQDGHRELCNRHFSRHTGCSARHYSVARLAENYFLWPIKYKI